MREFFPTVSFDRPALGDLLILNLVILDFQFLSSAAFVAGGGTLPTLRHPPSS